MFRSRALQLALFFFFFNLIFRLFLISKGPYHADCLFLATQAGEILKTGEMHYLQGSGLPLSALLGALFIALFNLFSIPDPVLAVNLMSVVCLSASLAFLYLFMEKELNSSTALFGTMLLSFNPLLLALSTFGNSNMPALLFFSLSLYFLAGYRQTPERKRLFLSAVALGLTGAARGQDLVIAALVFLILLFSSRKNGKPEMKNILIAALLLVVTLLLFYLPMFLKTTNADRLHMGLLQQMQLTPLPILWTYFKISLSILSPLEWAAAVIGFVLILRGKPNLGLALLVLFILPVLLYISLRFFVFRLIYLSMIPIAIAAGFALSHMPKRKWLKFTYLIIILGTIILHTNQFLPTIAFRHHHQLLADYFSWVGSITEDNAAIIERDHGLFIRYYAKRAHIEPDIELYGIQPNAFEDLRVSLDNLLSKGMPVYITASGLKGYRADVPFEAFLRQHYLLVPVGSHLTEDWHTGVLFHSVFYNDLFRITRKAN